MTNIDGTRVFDEDALLYDLERPSYPMELVSDVFSYSGLNENSRILEIGCGTGQATRLFAERGNPMLCLDPGPNLAGLARDRCSQYPNVRIETVSFEDWKLEQGAFDMVMSATAFHWIKPEVGLPKCAKALREAGVIALFWNKHPGPYSAVFEEISQQYEVYVPQMARSKDGSDHKNCFEQWIQSYRQRIDETGLYQEVVSKRYPWSLRYSKEHYLGLMDTYSDHRSLPPVTKNYLYDAIADVIERNGGTVTKEYVAVLFLARKRS